MSIYLSADDILDADDTVFFEVECPEWAKPHNPKGLVRCRTLTAAERDQWEAMMDKDANKAAKSNRGNARAHLVAKVIVDEDGKRVFTKPDQIERLGRKNVAAVNRIFEKVLDASKVAPEDVAELEGNSDAGPSGDSASI